MKKLFFTLTGLAMLLYTASAEGPYKAGDAASDFSLKSIKGQMVSLAGLSDAKGFIVVFTCNTCPVAKKYEQRIMDLDNEFRSKGYPVVAINSNSKEVSPGDSYEEMQKLAGNKGYRFEYLYDESQEVAKTYGATNTPHVYVLSKHGNHLMVEYVGAIDNNADDASNADKKYVEDAVNALLMNNPVQVTGTKAVGCGIKWRKG